MLKPVLGANEMARAEQSHEDQLSNVFFADAFPDADSPAELYRQVYKYTACGAYLSMQIEYYKTIEPDGFNDFPFDKLISEWVHSDALHQLGTWKDLDQQGVLVTAMMVGSIVEGIDQCTESIEVEANQLDEEPEEFHKRFYAALGEVEQEAESIWNDTHGCETCAKHWGINLDEELSPVWTECPDCQGHGTPI
jgi:hypothetical protein